MRKAYAVPIEIDGWKGTLIRSARKTLAIEINQGAETIIRAPFCCPTEDIIRFFREKQGWIAAHTASRERRLAAYPPPTEQEIRRLKEEARRVIPERVAHFAALMGVEPSAVSIRAAKTRFGSCSADNRLTFSCLLMRYPPAAIDYVVVHELAHIRHHHHQLPFYREIARILPRYREYEAILKGK